MANDRSIFMPAEGPFTNVLTENLVPQPPKPHPQGRVTPLAGVLNVGLNFMKGAADARLRNFQMEENERVKKYGDLQAYYQRAMADPNLTDEAKAHITQQVSRAFGGELATATGGEKGKGGKGKDGKDAGIAGHFKNIMHDLAIGMTGGKMPQGSKEIGDVYSLMGKLNAEIYGEEGKGKYNRQHILDSSVAELDKAAKALPPTATQEEAMRALAPYLQKIEGYDPQRANSLRKDYLPQFFPTGSPESTDLRISEALKAGSPPPPNVNGAAAGEIQGPSNIRGMGAEGPAGATAAPPQVAVQPVVKAGLPPEIDPRLNTLLRMGGERYMGKSQNVEYTDPDTGKLVKVLAQKVTLPDRPEWYYAGGKALPVAPDKISAASMTPARAERWTADKVVKDKNSPTGWSYSSTNLDDPKAEKRVTLGAPPPPSTVQRPMSPYQQEATKMMQMRLQETERKVAANKGLSKILQYTAEPDAGYLKGRTFLQYLRDEVLQKRGKGSWWEDPEVAPYASEIRSMIDTMDPKERTKKGTLDFLQQKAGQDSQEHMNAQTSHAMVNAIGSLSADQQQMHQSLMGELWGGGQGGGETSGGTSYDEVVGESTSAKTPEQPPRVDGQASQFEVEGQTFKVGQTVPYQGKTYRVLGKNNGKLVLDPNPVQ